MFRLLSVLLILTTSATANPGFGLVDTNPQSPEFQKRFLGSFGINSDIEPTLSQSDRPVFENIQPYLTSNPSRAIQIAQQSLNSDSNAAFDFLVGSLYYQQNNFGEAARYLQTALRKFPDFRRAHRNLALIYVQQNRLGEAIDHLVRVIELGGGDGQSYSLLGYAYLSNEKYQSALSAYQMARMFLPDSVDVRRGEAQALLLTNREAAATALFDELLAERPSEQSYWLLQANGFLSQEEYEDAIANLEIGHSVGSSSSQSLTLLGDLYLNQSLPSLAADNYIAAARSGSGVSSEQLMKPLRRLIRSGAYPEARTYLDAIANRLSAALSSTAETDRLILESQLLIGEGQIQEAVRVLENVLLSDPLNATALLAVADASLIAGDLPKAFLNFERALGLPDHKVEALVGLGRTAVADRKYEEALNYLKRSQQIEERENIAQYIRSVERVVSAL